MSYNMEKMHLNINPDDMKPMTCTECDGIYFKQVMSINKVSKFLTGGDKDTIIPIPVFRCDDCGSVPDEFQPISK